LLQRLIFSTRLESRLAATFAEPSASYFDVFFGAERTTRKRVGNGETVRIASVNDQKPLTGRVARLWER
jgi:hypothetical protein